MSTPYRTRVCERRFLNKAGFHAGAYVLAEVEDTSVCTIPSDEKGPHNLEPNLKLEIADCTRRINLEFDVTTSARRRNSLRKIHTLIVALERFQEALEVESTLYVSREREIKRARKRAAKEDGAADPAPSAISAAARAA